MNNLGRMASELFGDAHLPLFERNNQMINQNDTDYIMMGLEAQLDAMEKQEQEAVLLSENEPETTEMLFKEHQMVQPIEVKIKQKTVSEQKMVAFCSSPPTEKPATRSRATVAKIFGVKEATIYNWCYKEKLTEDRSVVGCKSLVVIDDKFHELAEKKAQTTKFNKSLYQQVCLEIEPDDTEPENSDRQTESEQDCEEGGNPLSQSKANIAAIFGVTVTTIDRYCKKGYIDEASGRIVVNDKFHKFARGKRHTKRFDLARYIKLEEATIAPETKDSGYKYDPYAFDEWVAKSRSVYAVYRTDKPKQREFRKPEPVQIEADDYDMIRGIWWI